VSAEVVADTLYEAVDDSSDTSGEGTPGKGLTTNRAQRFAAWIQDTNQSPSVIAAIRRARRVLPGDPDFGDRLSADGVGGARAAARAADRLLSDREAATREMSLATLQVWQAITERVSGRPANPEVTLVFTDLVGFSDWSLRAGDDATLRFLRRVAQVGEAPILDAGGQIVKRMGDGMMAVFTDPTTAVRATIASRKAVEALQVPNYTPRVRAGVHTGRPQRIGSDWLGVDVNIAARVMERAPRGGVVVSDRTLEHVSDEDLDSMGVSAKKIKRQVFGVKSSGVPADLIMFRLKARKDQPMDDEIYDGIS
jgi:class 3 adenylate cyclase